MLCRTVVQSLISVVSPDRNDGHKRLLEQKNTHTHTLAAHSMAGIDHFSVSLCSSILPSLTCTIVAATSVVKHHVSTHHGPDIHANLDISSESNCASDCCEAASSTEHVAFLMNLPSHCQFTRCHVRFYNIVVPPVRDEWCVRVSGRRWSREWEWRGVYSVL